MTALREPLDVVIKRLQSFRGPHDSRGTYLGDGVHESVRAGDLLAYLLELKQLREPQA